MLNFIKNLFREPGLKENELIGIWKCKKINNRDIINLGFKTIKLILKEDHSLEQETNMNAFGGDVTTRSNGKWELIDNQLIVKVGEYESKCSIHFKNGTVKFNPDPIFKEERIKLTEYVKSK